MADEFELGVLSLAEDPMTLEVIFRAEGERRSFVIAIEDYVGGFWQGEADHFDAVRAAYKLAEALLDVGADKLPHKRYLFDRARSPATLEMALHTIARKVPPGIDYFADPRPPVG